MTSFTTIAAAVLLSGSLGACSTAKQGSSSAEAAVQSSTSTVTTTTIAQAPALRVDTLHIEPSRQRDMPIVAPPSDTASGERATMIRLEREARAIAHSTGCSSVRACRSAPVGAKACGGPRTYITYCAASTDTTALMKKLRELERVEKAYNDKSGMMSTCEMKMPPVATLVNGSCGEAGGAPLRTP